MADHFIFPWGLNSYFSRIHFPEHCAWTSAKEMEWMAWSMVTKNNEPNVVVQPTRDKISFLSMACCKCMFARENSRIPFGVIYTLPSWNALTASFSKIELDDTTQRQTRKDECRRGSKGGGALGLWPSGFSKIKIF
jgi:hypothetical protein